LFFPAASKEEGFSPRTSELFHFGPSRTFIASYSSEKLFIFILMSFGICSPGSSQDTSAMPTQTRCFSAFQSAWCSELGSSSTHLLWTTNFSEGTRSWTGTRLFAPQLPSFAGCDFSHPSEPPSLHLPCL